MNCIIPGANIKIMGKAIYALSKIGDELLLEASKECLTFKSVNITTTAYCVFKFHSIFFSSYELDADTNATDKLICKMSMKAILGVFRSHGHKNKKPEFCVIKLQWNATQITFKFNYKHHVAIVRTLYLGDEKAVNVTYNKDSIKNLVSAVAQLFVQILLNFHMTDDDMGIEVCSTKAIIRNYITGEGNKTKSTRSQLTLTSGQFSAFNIVEETAINFSLKPFRAVIQFAEAFGLNISLYFETPGKPALVEVKDNTFEVNFIVATLRSSDESQSTLTSAAVSLKTSNKENCNITVEDQQALENEAWDDNAFDMQPKSINILSGRDVNQKHDKNDEFSDTDNASSESPHHKRLKMIFRRCFEPTFCESALNSDEILAYDSDPD